MKEVGMTLATRCSRLNIKRCLYPDRLRDMQQRHVVITYLFLYEHAQ